MSFKNIKDPTKYFSSSLHQKDSDLVVWGRSLNVSRDAAGGFQPLGNPAGQLDLVIIPPLGWDRPVLFTLDLLVIDVATGMPPVGLPPPPFSPGGFRVLFGGGVDSREFLFGPGIHSLIAESIRIRVVPQDPTGLPILWRFHAVCTVQEGVSPSYTIMGP